MKSILKKSTGGLVAMLLAFACSKDVPVSPMLQKASVSLYRSLDIILGQRVFQETFVIEGKQPKVKHSDDLMRTFEVTNLNGIFVFHLVNGNGEGTDAIDDAKIEINNKEMENDQNWDYEDGKRFDLGFPNGKHNAGYRYAKYFDFNRDPLIVLGTNELKVKPKTKNSGTLTVEVILQTYPLVVVNENFDSHPPGQLPQDLPLIINDNPPWEGWNIQTENEVLDYQGIIDDQSILPPSSPNFYVMRKISIDNTKMILVASPGWLMSLKGYQEAKLKLMQTNSLVHYGVRGQWGWFGILRFDEYGNIYAVTRGEWPNNCKYLFSYQSNTWYQVRIDWDSITNIYFATVNGQQYGPFQSIELNPYYCHAFEDSWLFGNNDGTVYIDDMKAVFNEAVVWDEWMDKNNPKIASDLYESEMEKLQLERPLKCLNERIIAH